MKLERLHESVPATIAIGIGLGMALGCGYWLANGEGKYVGLLVSGILLIGLLLFARERVWMLIPALAGLNGSVSALPMPFTAAQLGILVAFSMVLLLKALKIIRIKAKQGFVETWMWVVLFYLLTVYLRNPVGVEALGAERIGGKPYADVLIACLGYWVLAQSAVSIRQAFFVPLLGLVGTGAHALLNIITEHIGWTAGPVSAVYSGIKAAEVAAGDPLAPLPEENSRLGYLQMVGMNLVNVACTYWRPMTLINPLNLGRFLVFFLGLVSILLSGFRSNLMGIFEIFLLASYFRRGIREVLWVSAIGAAFIGLLATMQGTVFDLPLPAQRALSFLPGQWEEAAKLEAQSSTEWRIEMWKAMLTGHRYLENKWLGDGFGFTHQQFEIMVANSTTGSTADQQENLLISGGVHSGPVTTIKYVGYVGLFLFLVFLVLIARRGVRLIRRAQGTPFYPMALSLGLVSVLFPFNFVFIFGAFNADLPYSILMVGMQKLLENSLDAYEAETKTASPEVIEPPKARPIRQFAANVRA